MMDKRIAAFIALVQPCYDRAAISTSQSKMPAVRRDVIAGMNNN